MEKPWSLALSWLMPSLIKINVVSLILWGSSAFPVCSRILKFVGEDPFCWADRCSLCTLKIRLRLDESRSSENFHWQPTLGFLPKSQGRRICDAGARCSGPNAEVAPGWDTDKTGPPAATTAAPFPPSKDAFAFRAVLAFLQLDTQPTQPTQVVLAIISVYTRVFLASLHALLRGYTAWE